MEATFTVQPLPDMPQRGLERKLRALAVEDGNIRGLRGQRWVDELVLMTRWAQSEDGWKATLVEGDCAFRIEGEERSGIVVPMPRQTNLALFSKDGVRQACLCDESEERLGDALATLWDDGRWNYEMFRSDEKWSGHRLIIGTLAYFDELLAPVIAPAGPLSRPSALAERLTAGAAR